MDHAKYKFVFGAVLHLAGAWASADPNIVQCRDGFSLAAPRGETQYGTLPQQPYPGSEIQRTKGGELLGYSSKIPLGQEGPVHDVVVEALSRYGVSDSMIHVTADQNGGPSRLNVYLGGISNPSEREHVAFHGQRSTLRRFQQFLETGGRRVREVMMQSDNPALVDKLTNRLTPEDLMVINQAHLNRELEREQARGERRPNLSLQELFCN